MNNLINLNNDLMFKSIFGQKKYAKHLIKYVFDEDIVVVDVISQKQSSSTINSKQSFYDIFVITNKTIYIVEMQNEYEGDLEQRAFYYTTTSSNELLKKGQAYNYLKNIKIGIICNFKPYNLSKYKNSFKITSRDYFNIYYNFLEIRYINLLEVDSCINKKEKNFFNLLKGIKSNDPLIKEICNEMNKFNNSEEWRSMNRDYLSSYNTAVRVGRARGKKEGLEEGEILGIIKGEQIGLLKGKLEGKRKSIINTVNILKKLKLNKQEIIENLAENYDLEKEEIINIVCSTYLSS